MFEKIIKYFVYVLSFLLIIAFFAVIYGIYIKISPKASKNSIIEEFFSLNLEKEQEIKSMQVIDSNRILITVIKDQEIQGFIIDIDTQEIIQRIGK